jgi:hypothetical protein
MSDRISGDEHDLVLVDPTTHEPFPRKPSDRYLNPFQVSEDRFFGKKDTHEGNYFDFNPDDEISKNIKDATAVQSLVQLTLERYIEGRRDIWEFAADAKEDITTLGDYPAVLWRLNVVLAALTDMALFHENAVEMGIVDETYDRDKISLYDLNIAELNSAMRYEKYEERRVKIRSEKNRKKYIHLLRQAKSILKEALTWYEEHKTEIHTKGSLLHKILTGEDLEKSWRKADPKSALTPEKLQYNFAAVSKLLEDLIQFVPENEHPIAHKQRTADIRERMEKRLVNIRDSKRK